MNWNALLHDPDGLVKHPVELGALRVDVDSSDLHVRPFTALS
jgi:hypothetical protein